MNGGCTTRTGYFKCWEVKTGFYWNKSMQTGSSETLIGWKSGQTTFVPIWDRMEGAWLRTRLTVGRTKGCTCVSIWVPPRMRSNAVGGGGTCTLSLAWEGAVMMPLQWLKFDILEHRYAIHLYFRKLVSMYTFSVLFSKSVVDVGIRNYV